MMRLALALCLVLTAPASAQTILGVTLGEPIPEGLPTPIGTQTQAPFALTLWGARDGVSMSAIGDIETGEVLFIEMRSAADNPTDSPASAQIDGITFGETTRADLHARFGSEGVVFADVGRTGVFGEIAVYFTNYEIAGSDTVVSFVTIQPLADASEETANQSILDSVVVARGSYLDQVWGGNRGRLPGYVPISDPFTD